MSTRGVWGFRKNNEDKLMYNHGDSYPTYLGKEVFEAIKEYKVEDMKSAFDRMTAVDEDKKPTKNELKELAYNYRHEMSKCDSESWYVALREAQGNLVAYIVNKLPYYINSNNFIYDSLFCEWGYIINLDDNTLEVYTGFNTKESNQGRYASVSKDENHEYYGCTLIKVYTFNEIKKMTDETILEELNKLEEE